ncbi:MAG TPA: Flp pilus assembly protein CpaB [Defluviitaleaceae bacterium]|nr:Flp pilus assembly protein CpaB [Defluviitaleaceae bacterium]HQD92831.1 Flp pilus assembly protein CpaB [Bacilli bacterium]
MKNILRNRTVLGLVSIVMALIICFGLTPLFNKAMQEKVDIVRVTKDIKKGDLITKDMIQTMSVGGYNLPNEVIKNQENVIGKYALADFCKGDYILLTKLSNEPLTEHAYLYNLDGIKRAISITIKSFAAGLSGKLEQGDIVSIIASDYGEFRKTMIPNELQYVQVLAVTANSGEDRTYQEMKDEDQELPSTVTLLVNQEQAKLLAELEEKSKIHVALVYRGDIETSNKFLEEQDKVFHKEQEDQGENDAINNEKDEHSSDSISKNTEEVSGQTKLGGVTNEE